nr:DUF1854 domain-containing protein [Planctomycetota bacterium]
MPEITTGTPATTTSTEAAAEAAKPEIHVKPEELVWLDDKPLTVHWAGGASYVHLTVGDDRTALRIYALYAFPQSDPTHYIQIYAGKPDGSRGDMVGMLRNLNSASGEALTAIKECLRRAYVVPRIKRILSIADQRHLIHWVIETDRGVCEFDMNDMYKNIRIRSGGRIVLTDIFENRYEILNLADLDAPSKALIAPLI